ncbi:MAG: pentapeptide repeat-containing protein [Chloroflexi bacterium]|nr:pentapeptide repeat-containing protein [Chloroflexota bacterium]
MQSNEVATRFKTLYPEELVERYQKGERNFEGINLLRAELEHIFEIRQQPPSSPYYWPTEARETPHWFSNGYTAAVNPLWADYRDFEREFEWDSYGTFIPVEYDDLLPPRDLRGLDLSGINLRGAYLYPVDFTGTNLTGADLRKAKVFDGNFEGSVLRHADLRRATFSHANLRGADLYMARLERAALPSADLRDADLRRTKLRKAWVTSCNLQGAKLAMAHFRSTWLNYSNLEGVDMEDVELWDCVVTGVKIRAEQQARFLHALWIKVEP